MWRKKSSDTVKIGFYFFAGRERPEMGLAYALNNSRKSCKIDMENKDIGGIENGLLS